MNDNNEIMYPEVYSNEFVVNIENVRFTLITQETAIHLNNHPREVIVHFHECYEIFCCQKGEFFVDIDGEKITFKEGEALVVPPRVYHALSGAAPGSHQISLYFDISSNGQKSAFDLYKIISKVVGDSWSLLPGMKDIGDVIGNIRRACEEKNYYKISVCVHSFLMKLVELTGNIPQNHDVVYSDNPNLRVHNIHTFIHRHLTETLSLDDLASKLRLSTRQTSRIIKASFGCTFKELVTKLRMEKAGELMLRTNYKVSEISEMVGYSSERGFYAAFKNRFGCLPKEYRKKIAHKS